ncbi:MAG: alpha/beta hydrolase family protein [Anaerolineae bacterium]
MMRVGLSMLSFVLLLIVIVLSVALAWLIYTRQPYEKVYRPDAPTYGERGAYTVGVQQFTITGEDRPLNGWVWYPAQGTPELANYSAFNGVFEASGRANWDAQPRNDGAPYPLVVFSHGSGASPLLSLFFTEHLASQGFVVIATEHPANTMIDRIGSNEAYDDAVVDNYIYRPQDVRRTIDYALDDLNVGALSGMIDAERIAVAGHSFGGYTSFASAGARLNLDALAQWCADNDGVTVGDVRNESALTASNRDVLLADGACYLLDNASRLAELMRLPDVPTGAWPSLGDERISAVIALAPWNAPIFGEENLTEITLPALIMVGSNDNTTKPERDAHNFYSWLGSEDKTLVEFVLGDHSLFVDQCPPVLINAGFYASCSDPVWDLARAHNLTNHLATAFLRATFYDDAGARTALNTAGDAFAGITVQRP